ncbi:MAG: hypothetical protein ACTH1W_03810 [Advenella sp.]|uniref:hypothetical protein n=1 Tax=Advenella sp. S44 TaxID=1982755 RepID=UPI001290311D|nr:hypothetical protein [Advenella sp. S44]
MVSILKVQQYCSVHCNGKKLQFRYDNAVGRLHAATCPLWLQVSASGFALGDSALVIGQSRSGASFMTTTWLTWRMLGGAARASFILKRMGRPISKKQWQALF